MLTSGGYWAEVRVPLGEVEILRQLSGVPLSLDPQHRYLVERVQDESVFAPDGSPKRYEISHLYLVDLKKGTEEKWRIPFEVQKFLPSNEKCWVADNEFAMGWEPTSGRRFLFTVECGSRFDISRIKQYVLVVDRTLKGAHLLWWGAGSTYIIALWDPRGRRILLQTSHLDANGISKGGETVLLDEQGRVIRRWQGFPTPSMMIMGWGVP